MDLVSLTNMCSFYRFFDCRWGIVVLMLLDSMFYGEWIIVLHKFEYWNLFIITCFSHVQSFILFINI
jgi:hypothetical protein